MNTGTAVTALVGQAPAATYNDQVRASYAAQDARRVLGELPPALYKDVMAFARAGLPHRADTVAEWLAGRGTWGEVSSLVAKILEHQKHAAAALASV